MDELNTKAVLRMVKANRRGRLMWHKTEELEMVTNGLFLVAQEQLDICIRAALFEAFDRVANPGDRLCLSFGSLRDEAPDLLKVYQPDKATVRGEVTPLTIDSEYTMRLLHFENGVHSVVDDSFAALMKDPRSVGVWSEGGKNSVIYFGEQKKLLVSPVIVASLEQQYLNPAGLRAHG